MSSLAATVQKAGEIRLTIRASDARFTRDSNGTLMRLGGNQPPRDRARGHDRRKVRHPVLAGRRTILLTRA